MIPFTLDGFLLVFGRLSGIVFKCSYFQHASRSRQTVKVLIISIFALTLSYYIPIQYYAAVDTPGKFAAAMAMEIFVGLFVVGLLSIWSFAAIQLAGQIMDMQLGFAIVNVVDPLSGTQIPLMGNLTQTLALLLYLAINGHHYLIQALVKSYQVIPVLGTQLSGDFYDLMIKISVLMFVVAVKIAAPILFVTITADIAMGYIARTVPQMNVFIIGLPLKILVGLVALAAFLPAYVWIFDILFSSIFRVPGPRLWGLWDYDDCRQSLVFI